MEEECDAKGCFRRASQPAGKDVFVGASAVMRLDEIEVMGTNSHMVHGLSGHIRYTQAAAPVERFDFGARDGARAGEVLAARQSGDLDARRVTKDFLLISECGNFAAREDEQLAPESVSLFDIVRDEESRAVECIECFLKLLLHLAAQVRVEGCQSLVEKKRFGLDGKSAGQGNALLLAAG